MTDLPQDQPWPAPTPVPPPPTATGRPVAAASAASADPAAPTGAVTSAGDPTAAGADLPTTELAEGACLVAIAFRDPLYAQEALLAAMRLAHHGHLQIEDAAIVSRAGDRVRIQQTKDMNPADGAMAGGWWGLLAGLFVGGPLIGGALGAALGGLWAKLRDIGISDPEMKRLGESLGQDEAALFLLLRGAHRWHAMAEVRRFPGRILHTTLAPAEESEIVEALGSAITTL